MTTKTTTTTTISPLRQRMIEDMKARKLGTHSQRNHIGSCKRFSEARFRQTTFDTPVCPRLSGDGCGGGDQEACHVAFTQA